LSGGGINNVADHLTIRHSTITANTAPAGRGSGIFAGNNTPSVVVYSTIVAGNTNSDFDRSGSMVKSAGYNLIGTGSAASWFNQTGDHVGLSSTVLMLAPLANNGGPNRTHALLPGSAAIDAGQAGVIPGNGDIPEFDQRGFAYSRVVGGQIDIGAFEVGASSADFDLDGDVDGRDFMLWQRNPSIGNLSTWQEQYELEDDLSTVESISTLKLMPAYISLKLEIAREMDLQLRGNDMEGSCVEDVDRALEELMIMAQGGIHEFGEMVPRRTITEPSEIDLDHAKWDIICSLLE
jgi:hypothetical protein